MMNAVCKFLFHSEVINSEHYLIINNLFAFYRTNGQVLGSVQIDFINSLNQFQVIAYLPNHDSLNGKWDNNYITRTKEELRANGIHFSFSILSEDSAANIFSDVNIRNKEGFFVLEADPFEIKSPLFYCLNRKKNNIPLYLLPKTYQDESYYDIISWESNYQSLSKLYMNSYNDRYFSKQLTDPDSSLCCSVQNICKKLERSTGIKSFFKINSAYLTENKKRTFIKKYSFHKNYEFESYSFFSKKYRLVLG